MSRLFCISKCIQQRVKISLCSHLYVTENSIVLPKVFTAVLNLSARAGNNNKLFSDKKSVLIINPAVSDLTTVRTTVNIADVPLKSNLR